MGPRQNGAASPLLSILVCGTERRLVETTTPLLADLYARVRDGGYPIEILALIDNYTQSIGQKRNALLDLARGDYVSFVDDDDWLAPEYFPVVCAALREQQPIDLLVYGMVDQDSGKVHFRSRHSGAEFHTCVLRRALITRTQARFPDLSYGQDALWSDRVREAIEHEVILDREVPLYLQMHDVPSDSEERRAVAQAV